MTDDLNHDEDIMVFIDDTTAFRRDWEDEQDEYPAVDCVLKNGTTANAGMRKNMS